MRISDWSSDVCSSDLGRDQSRRHPGHAAVIIRDTGQLERAGDRTGAAKQLRHVGETVGGEEMAADADRAVVDRKTVVWGRSVYVRCEFGGRAPIKKKNTQQVIVYNTTAQ